MPNSLSSPSISVVVPATDRPDTLPACLAAIKRGRAALEANGAGQRSGAAGSELIVVREPAGAGPAEARNIGAGLARGEVVCFVDADVEIHPDALERIAGAFRRDPALGAVFGAYDTRPPAPGAASRFRNLLHHHVHAREAGPARTFWAGLGAVRRDLFDAQGGFDAALFPHPAVEDIELGARLDAAGGRILLDPRISGAHLKRWSLTSMVRTDLTRRGIPWVRLILAGRAPASALNAGPRARLSALASALVVALALLRRPLAAAAVLAALLAAERPLFRLLAERGGRSLALAGIPLLVVHHLTALASVPAGLVAHAIDRDRFR
jgi:hypothetical protein